MIEVNGLSKNYGDLAALSNVSFTVEKGQIVGFLGANGAGKSTTMDILCGCIGADSGFAKVAGFDITERPLEAKRRLGYLPDVAPLHHDMLVSDYIAYAAELHKVERGQIAARVSATIEKLALGDVRNRVIGNLSKGYRQRVGLAQALVHDPEVLVLDEPTEGLDPTQIAEIRKLIKSLAGQHTILLSSHILSEV
jgi:ABC-2 type transport system ATP-binding protein